MEPSGEVEKSANMGGAFEEQFVAKGSQLVLKRRRMLTLHWMPVACEWLRKTC